MHLYLINVPKCKYSMKQSINFRHFVHKKYTDLSFYTYDKMFADLPEFTNCLTITLILLSGCKIKEKVIL